MAGLGSLAVALDASFLAPQPKDDEFVQERSRSSDA